MRNSLTVLTLAAGLLAAPLSFAEDLGKKSYEACIACHSLKADDNQVGPSLHGLIGRQAGSVPGFRYSGPMKRSGIVWDEKTLTDFLRNPQEVIKGTRMPFSGIADEKELKALVTYLQSVTK